MRIMNAKLSSVWVSIKMINTGYGRNKIKLTSRSHCFAESPSRACRRSLRLSERIESEFADCDEFIIEYCSCVSDAELLPELDEFDESGFDGVGLLCVLFERDLSVIW